MLNFDAHNLTFTLDGKWSRQEFLKEVRSLSDEDLILLLAGLNKTSHQINEMGKLTLKVQLERSCSSPS